MIKINDLRLPFKAGPQELHAAAASLLGLVPGDVLSLELLRKAVDARHKSNISFTYSVAVEVRDQAAVLRAAPTGKAEAYHPPVYELPNPGEARLSTRPVVVGAGPAGLLAAWVLARAGYRPLLLERGVDMVRRRQDVQAFMNGGALNTDSNIQFGEGGAGAFSDGKLVTRSRDPRCAEVLKLLVKCGAPQEILYWARAHVGTDRLWSILPAIRREIEGLGGEYRFSHTLQGLIMNDGRLSGLRLAGGATVDAQATVLAVGHSARETVRGLLAQGMAIEAKPFAVGFRVEHPQRMVDRAAWGGFAGDARLGAADYRLSTHVGERAVHSFCMCPGGFVVNASSQGGRLAVNGMSLYDRAGGNANAAIVAAVDPAEMGAGPLAGLDFQQELEERACQRGDGWHAPAQRMADYLAGRPSQAFGGVEPTVRPQAVPADLNGILPEAVNGAVQAAMRQFGRQLPGFLMDDAVLTAVESRTSAPVRMARGADMQAEGIAGLYPAGEGAGWAGGILSAAADGMKAAEALIAQWRM